MSKLRKPNCLMSIKETFDVRAMSSARSGLRLYITIVSCNVYNDLKATRAVREKVQAEFGVTPTVGFSSFKPADADASIDSVTVRLPPTPRYNREVVRQRVRAIAKEAFPTAGTIKVIEASNSSDD